MGGNQPINDNEGEAELACVGTGWVGVSETTAELHAMTYREAMKHPISLHGIRQ